MNEPPAAISRLIAAGPADRSHSFCGCGFSIGGFMNEQLIPVSGNQKIAFQCQRCSACCRHVENKVMLEPYDVYQLALHFQSEGQPVRPEDI